MLGSNKVPGKALIKLADESRPPAERDETVGFTVQFISGGTEYSIQLSVTVSDDGTFSYLFGRVQAKLDLAAPMSEIFWLSKTRTLESYEFLKIGGKYFHQWLGATEDGDMYIREDEDDETSNIVYTLSTGSHGEAAHVITRRATLENFLKFIRGDAAPSESQWSAMGLGLTTLINELNES